MEFFLKFTSRFLQNGYNCIEFQSTPFSSQNLMFLTIWSFCPSPSIKLLLSLVERCCISCDSISFINGNGWKDQLDRIVKFKE